MLAHRHILFQPQQQVLPCRECTHRTCPLQGRRFQLFQAKAIPWLSVSKGRRASGTQMVSLPASPTLTLYSDLWIHAERLAGPKQTSVKQDTLKPVWNEDIVFEGLDMPAAYTVRVNLFDKDTFLGTGHLDWLAADDKLGHGTVDLGTLYNSREFQDKELIVERRKFGLFTATLNIGLCTLGQWGNSGDPRRGGC